MGVVSRMWVQSMGVAGECACKEVYTSGIYRCDIETIAVNSNSGNASLFVGLYTSGGESVEKRIIKYYAIKSILIKGACPNYFCKK